jgi:hypothetical protein
MRRQLTALVTYGAPVGCPEGTSWRYSQTGTAWLSHLGRVAFELTHRTGPATGSTWGTWTGEIAYQAST